MEIFKDPLLPRLLDDVVTLIFPEFPFEPEPDFRVMAPPAASPSPAFKTIPEPDPPAKPVPPRSLIVPATRLAVVTFPVAISRLPEFPTDDDPVRTTTLPDSADDDDAIRILPLDNVVEFEVPDINFIKPPALENELPAFKLIEPPAAPTPALSLIEEPF